MTSFWGPVLIRYSVAGRSQPRSPFDRGAEGELARARRRCEEVMWSWECGPLGARATGFSMISVFDEVQSAKKIACCRRGSTTAWGCWRPTRSGSARAARRGARLGARPRRTAQPPRQTVLRRCRIERLRHRSAARCARCSCRRRGIAILLPSRLTGQAPRPDHRETSRLPDVAARGFIPRPRRQPAEGDPLAARDPALGHVAGSPQLIARLWRPRPQRAHRGRLLDRQHRHGRCSSWLGHLPAPATSFSDRISDGPSCAVPVRALALGFNGVIGRSATAGCEGPTGSTAASDARWPAVSRSSSSNFTWWKRRMEPIRLNDRHGTLNIRLPGAKPDLMTSGKVRMQRWKTGAAPGPGAGPSADTWRSGQDAAPGRRVASRRCQPGLQEPGTPMAR